MNADLERFLMGFLAVATLIGGVLVLVIIVSWTLMFGIVVPLLALAFLITAYLVGQRL